MDTDTLKILGLMSILSEKRKQRLWGYLRKLWKEEKEETIELLTLPGDKPQPDEPTITK